MISVTDLAPGQWPVEKSKAWWAKQAWPRGFNFLPSSAVNFIEMWQAETFDREGIARELKWAADVGFNALRTNPQFIVWEQDKAGFKNRFRWFVETAGDLGISTMPTLFDDCGFGGFEPFLGPQPEPVPYLHNSRAVASPGRALLMDKANWPRFEAYVKDMVSSFADEPHILLWDLYNEPGNRAIFEKPGSMEWYDPAMTAFSCELMEASFRWARDVAPSQPLSVGAWSTPQAGDFGKPFDTQADRMAVALSDVITFHAYTTREMIEKYLPIFEASGRPVLITEWMARTIGSRIKDQLQLFHDRKIGCYNWGLVQGRSQTHLPWPQRVKDIASLDKAEWFHDIFHTDGTPYDPAEVELISALAARS